MRVLSEEWIDVYKRQVTLRWICSQRCRISAERAPEETATLTPSSSRMPSLTPSSSTLTAIGIGIRIRDADGRAAKHVGRILHAACCGSYFASFDTLGTVWNPSESDVSQIHE